MEGFRNDEGVKEANILLTDILFFDRFGNEYKEKDKRILLPFLF